MKSSEILREAKQRLWEGKERYIPLGKALGICSAIYLASSGIDPKTTRKGELLQNRITRSMPGFMYVCDWLYIKVGVPQKLLTYKNLYEYRMRWLDELAAQYEAKGD